MKRIVAEIDKAIKQRQTQARRALREGEEDYLLRALEALRKNAQTLCEPALFLP